MRKALMVDPEKCTGCRTCEMACSMRHEEKCSPLLSRIRILKFEAHGINSPSVCSHCSKPQCIAACLLDAISLNTVTGAVVINEELCTGCCSCLTACPGGQISLHPDKKVAFKCDLCDGDPACARFCPSGAVQYCDVDQFLMMKRRARFSRIKRAS